MLNRSHLLPKVTDSPVNVIARAGGAPTIPEVDVPALEAQTIEQPMAAKSYAASSPVLMSAAVAAPPDPAPAVLRSIMMTEEEFEASPFALFRMDPSTMVLVSIFFGGFYFVVDVLPAIDVHGLSGGAWVAWSYVVKTAAAILVGIASIYGVSKIFESRKGDLRDISLQTLTVHMVLEVALLAAVTVMGSMLGSLASIPIAAYLARSMFRLNVAELVFVILINLAARLVLVWLVLGWIMGS